MIFHLMIFNTLSQFAIAIKLAVALLTNRAVYDNTYLVKIEAPCMLALFLCFYCLHPPPRI